MVHRALPENWIEMKGRMFAALLVGLFAAGPHAAVAGKGASAAAVRAPAPDVVLDRAFLIGFWTDDDDCSNVIEFSGDGGFIVANGGTGRWKLAGDRLTMTGTSTATIRIVPIDRDTITVVHEDGSLGRSTRCVAPEAGGPLIAGSAS